MALLTVEELRALGDIVVNKYLDDQEELNKNMVTYELMHIADSFGLPGSMTEGGKRYKLAATEFNLVQLQLALYCIVMGYVSADEYAPLYDELRQKLSDSATLELESTDPALAGRE